MAEDKETHSPSYFVRKRLFGNKAAMFGLAIIAVAHIIAFLGYLIMSDQTPNANDGALSIKKQGPGFKATILKEYKSREIVEENFFTKAFFGQESPYTIEAVDTFYLKGDSVYYRIHGENYWETKLTLTMVEPLYQDDDKSLCSDKSCVYRITGETIQYIHMDGKTLQQTKKELETKFYANNVETRYYPLGTDKKGRDMLSRLLFGTRISLSIGFISVIISMVVGIVLGAIGGFFGGFIDKALMWLLTVTWSIPGIMLVIAISLALQSKGIWVAFVAVGLTMWVEVARVVRGQIIGIKEKLYVEAAKALGISNMRIIFYHILPNMIGPLIVIATSNFASAILIESGLSFLGLGVQPPMPSWGMMVSEGYHSNWSDGGWYLVFFPSMCISVLVLAFNLFGNGLRDAYDPRTTTKW
ncbi:MAG: ABC transporter permease [Cytophagaceae bacterium]|jgi:peptide/nickel transport system permease protein|nr:ABC transporter permease [Cytophagaceae bacterium]